MSPSQLPHPPSSIPVLRSSTPAREFELERYKYILQQLHASNENVHRFMALFQTIVTALATGGIALLVGYKKWGIEPPLARAGVEGIVWLIVLTTIFAILLIAAGVFTWIDYRREECELLTQVSSISRLPPTWKNFWRWHETYIVLFMLLAAAFLCFYAQVVVVPSIK